MRRSVLNSYGVPVRNPHRPPVMFVSHVIAPLLLVVSVLGAPAVDLETRQSSSCSDLHLVHLSGTTESGPGSVGTPLASALASAVPGTTAYAVPYDTSAEYVATVAAGATATANYLNSQASKCPNQRFVLSGYSKGALVIHKTSLTSAVQSKVLNILVFGDPARDYNRPWPINSPSVDSAPGDGSTPSQNIASFCNTGDQFCYPGGTSLAAHLAYPRDGSIDVAAKFVKDRA